jgi:hypothetical protein
MTLTEFLTARLDEDEAWARIHGPVIPWGVGSGPFKAHINTYAGNRVAEARNNNYARHIARHDPARVLAEVAAKRAIVNMDEDDRYSDAYVVAIRALAAAYADHPDYDEAWRP